MKKKRIGLVETSHLKDKLPWTMGVSGVIRMIVWETESVLGISKTKYQNRIIKSVYKLLENNVLPLEEIQRVIKKEVNEEIKSCSVENKYDPPKQNILISPIEAQRRLRFFSEEFLNYEFDIFLSLLPNKTLTNYFFNYFNVSQENDWNIIGNSNDYEQSTGIKFMYMDTLAYSHNSKTLVALELKMDSQLGSHQLLKYMFMAAYLEDIGFIAPNTNFKLLIISPDHKTADKLPGLIQNIDVQIKNKEFPKKGVTIEQMEAVTPNVKKVLKNVEIQSTTWQEFGDHFQSVLDDITPTESSETFHKLVKGFLTTLEKKYSRKFKKPIYTKQNNQ